MFTGVSEKAREAAVWLREKMVGGGIKASISDRSGIVKLEIPNAGRRSPMLYADEIRVILDHAPQLREFLNANEDICVSAGESREMRKIRQSEIKRKAKAAEALGALSKTELMELLKQAAGQ